MKMNQLTKGPVGFALVHINGHTPDEISAGIAAVCGTLSNTDAVIDCIFSGFVIATYGTMAFQTKPPESAMKEITEAIRSNDHRNLRVVWGVYHGGYGNIGSGTRFVYSFIIPDFLQAFTLLQSAPLGQILRI